MHVNRLSLCVRRGCSATRHHRAANHACRQKFTEIHMGSSYSATMSMRTTALLRCPHVAQKEVWVVLEIPLWSAEPGMLSFACHGTAPYLLKRHAAIDGEARTGHVARRRAGQIGDQFGDVFGLAHWTSGTRPLMCSMCSAVMSVSMGPG